MVKLQLSHHATQGSNKGFSLVTLLTESHVLNESHAGTPQKDIMKLVAQQWQSAKGKESSVTAARAKRSPMRELDLSSLTLQ